MIFISLNYDSSITSKNFNFKRIYLNSEYIVSMKTFKKNEQDLTKITTINNETYFVKENTSEIKNIINHLK